MHTNSPPSPNQVTPSHPPAKHVLSIQAIENWAAGKGPLHKRLAQALGSGIEKGEIPAGTRLPAERALARALAISRSTVVAAYATLREQGWVESRQGSGTWVVARHKSTTSDYAEPQREFRRTSVFRGLIEGSGDTIELVAAHLPGCGALNAELMAECGAEVAREAKGHGYMPLGLPALRRAIARSLDESGLPTGEEQILVTTGAQQAISLTASLFLQRGDAVVLENPTYITAIDVYQSLGARLMPVGVTPQGVRVDHVRELLERNAPRLVYLMPTFHNPTGAVLPEEGRRELARMVDESGVPLIEDNTLSDLTLGDEPPPPIASFSKSGPVLTVGSLSKLFWGGLRVGWIRGPEGLILRLARLRVLSDLGSPVVGQVVAARLLAETERVKAERRRQISERLTLLTELMRSHLPGFAFTRPDGGLSLWVRMPFGNASELAQVAARHGVSLLPGSLASPDSSFPDHLRIPFVLDPETMREGIQRLARAWNDYAPAAARQRATLDVIV
jgi:DNA-binding transcriptional MocR family regulator